MDPLYILSFFPFFLIVQLIVHMYRTNEFQNATIEEHISRNFDEIVARPQPEFKQQWRYASKQI
ncbi:MAG: hypothetical protein CL887_04660 [Dehalococcoidia bacterium]|nr:hypothetical protein [Chloroflexota bacterium]MBR97769.1 hypothetical protein [Dehalococcoidia bacterium]